MVETQMHTSERSASWRITVPYWSTAIPLPMGAGLAMLDQSPIGRQLFALIDAGVDVRASPSGSCASN